MFDDLNDDSKIMQFADSLEAAISLKSCSGN